MPIYEFKCDKCNNVIEVIQKLGDLAPICFCCEKEMKKLISLSSFQLKGQGWYRDGYAKKSNEVKK